MAQDENRIKEILEGLAQPAQQPGLLQRILAAIPQAISVGFSPQPAQALTGVLQQRSAEQQAERDRQQRIQLLGANLEIDDILSRAKEKRQEEFAIRAEERADRRTLGAEERQEQRDISAFNRNLFGQEKIEGIKFEQAKGLQELQTRAQENLSRINHNYNLEVTKLQNSNETAQRKIGYLMSMALPAITSGHMSGDEAYKMTIKALEDGQLDADDLKSINKAIKSSKSEEQRFALQRISAEGRARAAASGANPQQAILELKQKYLLDKNNQLAVVTDSQGNQRLEEYKTDPLTGSAILPLGLKFIRDADVMEKSQYFDSAIAPLIGGFNPQQPNVTQQKVQSGIDQVIKDALAAGSTAQQIIEGLNRADTQAKLKVTPQDVQDALKRNNIQAQPPAQIAKVPTFEEDVVAGIAPTAGVKEATPEQIKEKLLKDKEKFQAAKGINFLLERLKTKTSLRLDRRFAKSKGASTTAAIKELDDDIEDIKNRLEDAYIAHPELRPK